MKSNEKSGGHSSNLIKSSRSSSKRNDFDQKKKKEEEHTQQVFEEFVATFEEPSKSRAWVKGGVVNPSSGSSEDTKGTGRIYRPVSKLDSKLNKTEGQNKADLKKSTEKPPALGKRKGQEQKKSKLEQFKEELKLIQQQREQRHALRQGRNQPSTQSELDLSDVGMRNREYRRGSSNNQGGDSGMGFHNTVSTPPSFYSKRSQNDRHDVDYPYDYDGDRTTTNLFLGNLNPKMTEQQLCEAFGRYGPLASVKIMWPRTEEERSRGRNCGFVAFMNRKDGERALDNIRGKELMGFEMKLGWGKSVPIPLYPVYIPPALLELVKPPPPSGLPFNAQPREWLKSFRLAIKERAKLVTDGADGESAPPPPAPDRKPYDINKMSSEELTEVLREAVVKVVMPSDRSILALIHRMIEFVVLEGPQFEAAVMHREANNPMFKFLFDYQSSDHVYYRWKLWSVLHGESVTKWRTEEFRMFEGGPLWRPPPVNLFSGGMPEDLVEEDDYPYAPGYVPPPSGRRRESEDLQEEIRLEAAAASRRCGLTEAQRGRFTQMLEDLEPCRIKIGEVMVWCLEHADSASDIALCIVDSVAPNSNFTSNHLEKEINSVDENPISDFKSDQGSTEHEKSQSISINKLVARLFLASDILYNSSAKVPNASFFRKCFETCLPDMFKNLNSHYKNVEGKLKAEQLKQKVMLCFRAWEDWAVYPNEFLIKLQNIFLGLVSEAVDYEADLSGVPLNLDEDEQNQDLAKKVGFLNPDVEVLESQPLVQYDGDPLDVDGSPLDNEDDRSPSPVRPKNSQFSAPATEDEVKPSGDTSNRLFVPSKWETVETTEPETLTVASIWESASTLDMKKDQPISKSSDNIQNTPNHLQNQPNGLNKGAFLPSELVNGIPLDTSRWSDNASTNKDDDVDGEPLPILGGLVAYDDEDAASPVASESSLSPIPVSQIPCPTPVTSSTSHVSSTPSSTSTTTPVSEERRAILREVELKVLKYQDELEASRKGDKTITDEAINKQIQRYRERLLESLVENEHSVHKKGHKSVHRNKSKPSKCTKEKSGLTPHQSKYQSRGRDMSSSPTRRNSRDRSPPRSFRDRDRPRRRHASPSGSLGPGDWSTYNSPSIRMDSRNSSERRRTSASGWEPDSTEDEIDYSTHLEDAEEGEATEDDDAGAFTSNQSHSITPKKKHVPHKSNRKRHRSRSPDPVAAHNRHSHRSRTPSPTRKKVHSSDSASRSLKRK
uniref:U2 snRNP-associated SURP motif-containing protein n=1 Tax=Schistosoma mansoni TaxID=6183 RepID=A0A3Q0KRB0_SCHMA